MLGSKHFVLNLSEEEKSGIALNLNFDMLVSCSGWMFQFSKPLVKYRVRCQTSLVSRLSCRGGESWCTLLAHAPSSLGNLHTTLLH